MANRNALASYIDELISFIDANRDKPPDDLVVLLRHRLTEDRRAANYNLDLFPRGNTGHLPPA